MTRELQHLHDSGEISFKVSSFPNGGVDWTLGDAATLTIASGKAATVEEAIRDLCDAACTHFPESFFSTGKR